jgi:uridylate kinase
MPAGDRVVYALGGSLVAPDTPRLEYIREFCMMVSRIAVERPDTRFLLVVGGGGPARQYIREARAAGASEEECDWVGIAATRLNAQLLITALKHSTGAKVHPTVPLTTQESANLSKRYTFVVMGGTQPGHSTDYVGAELAFKAQATRFLVPTNVAGVYNKDPRIHPDARMLPQLTADELVQIVGSEPWTAGKAGVMDPKCAALVRAKKIPAFILHGADMTAMRAASLGERFRGSFITFPGKEAGTALKAASKPPAKKRAVVAKRR